MFVFLANFLSVFFAYVNWQFSPQKQDYCEKHVNSIGGRDMLSHKMLKKLSNNSNLTLALSVLVKSLV